MEKLYVGLDVGTSSVGWAVTDEDYNILRLKGKKAWGSRIFSEANTKKDTRIFRSNRRRIARRKYRIQLLQELFAEEMSKVDSSFFLRLENSMFHLEDKNTPYRNLIFKNRDDEREFYSHYPTIWHLRKSLVNNDSYAFSNLKHVYLALHHIIKYRGNFLLEGSFSTSTLEEAHLYNLNNFLKNKYISEYAEEFSGDFIDVVKTTELKNILLNKNLKKTNKQKLIRELFKGNSDITDAYVKMFSVIVTGGTYKLLTLNKELEDSVTFEGNFDDIKDKLMNTLQEDFEIISIAKSIYDFIVLNELIGDETSISNVMCNIHEEHKNDLKTLKEVIINIDLNRSVSTNERLYDLVFKCTKIKAKTPDGKKDKEKVINNYVNLIGNNTKRIKLEDFNSFILSLLKDNETYVSPEFSEKYSYLVEKATNKKLLKMISHASTSVIPHQLHLMELEQIIDNASCVYPFLKEIKDKLILLFKYRIHYSYGPLDDSSKYSNVDRKNHDRITPWNIKEIINDSKTKEKFMKKLTNSCTYLIGEKVMPKASLNFEKFLILDKLNVLKVNGESLVGKEKQLILDFILSRPKTTLYQLKQYIAHRFNVKLSDVLISNIKEDVIFEATSHAQLSKTFDIIKDYDRLEYFIYLATVYADDKKALKDLLITDYSDLSESQVKNILTLPTKKWAPISNSLLTNLIFNDEETGEQVSLLSFMTSTNNNLQMALNHHKYNFNKLIDEFNNEVRGTKSDEIIISEILDETPAKFRRSVHQTMLILSDIEKASKRIPDKIFIEVTREDDEKKKGKETTSREKEVSAFIDSLFKDASEDASRLKEEYDLLEKSKLRNKHIYLYFKQQGRDMYTNKPIDLKDVIFGDKYDLDHIIPQSLIKDDSLDNLVLVEKEYNQKIKSDIYPIPMSIKTDSVLSLWYRLRKINAISEKKYSNLLRTSEISLQEIENFVASQINAVNYSNIVLKKVLEIKYPSVKIVFSKAQYPSYIRKKLEIAKNRDVNDTHHAVDAYLNIFAGNVLSTKYSNPKKLYDDKKNGGNKSFNMVETLKNKLDCLDKTAILYKEKIKNTCLRRDILVTFKVDYNNGALYNSTIFKASDSDSLIPVHTNGKLSDTSKYGGYSDLKQSYIMAIEYIEKGKKYKKLLRVPLILEKTCKNDEELITKVVNNENATDIKLIRKIHLNQKIRYQGCEYLLYTSNENQNKYKMSYQNYISNEYLLYLEKANKNLEILDDSLSQQEIIVNRKEEVFEFSKSKHLVIFDYLIETSKKNIYDSCNYIVKLRDMNRNVFIECSMKQQVDVLNNFIISLSRSSENSSFKVDRINAPNNCKMLLTNNITDSRITLIYESATGLFSHEVVI